LSRELEALRTFLERQQRRAYAEPKQCWFCDA
jgi:hypothetical protein